MVIREVSYVLDISLHTVAFCVLVEYLYTATIRELVRKLKLINCKEVKVLQKMKGVSLLVSDMPVTSLNSNHSDKLEKFSSHCRLYYQTSLSFHDSEMTTEQKSAIQATFRSLDSRFLFSCHFRIME